MGVSIRVNKGHYYLDITVSGRRKWESTGLTVSSDPKQERENLRLAEIIRSKREQQLVSGEWGLLDPLEGKRSLVSYCEELAAPMDVRTHLPKSLKYLREFAGGIQIGAVTERWLEGYRAHLLAAPLLGKTTASHYFGALCTALKRATRDRVIPRNPADAVAKIPVPEAMKVYLTEEELKALAAHPVGGILGGAIVKGFFFAVYTGLRVSDVSSLTWGKIERTPKPRILKRQEKTGRTVGIPLSPAAWTLIKDDAIHHQDELVFPQLTASKASPLNYFRSWAKKAGIEKKIGWHTARHTFAVLSLEAGTDLYTVSKLLGHTSISTTQGYAKATDGMRREAVERLPEFEIRKG